MGDGVTTSGGAGVLCGNCGTGLIGDHCHRCGQAGDVHRSIGAVGHDIAHGVFHFEGRAWRTLPMLVWRPGDLTRRYAAGERRRFVPPMALFLFAVFLLFTIVANLPGWSISNDLLRPGGAEAVRQQVAAADAAARRDVGRLSARLADARAAPGPDAQAIERLERRLADATATRDGIATAGRALGGAVPGAGPRITVTGTGAAWMRQRFDHARANPSLTIYKVRTAAYKFGWALIPISLPFLWLLFPFSRRFGLYDHAIFATYSLSFMSLLTVVLAVLGALGVPSETLFWPAMLIPPAHIYRQMRGAYSLRRRYALLRTVLLLGMIALLIVPLFALLLIYLGIA